MENFDSTDVTAWAVRPSTQQEQITPQDSMAWAVRPSTQQEQITPQDSFESSQVFEFADQAPFPQKLFTLMTKESPSIIAWIPTGNAFRILDSDKFQSEVIPKYFKHSKFASFLRQLNLYGFRRVTKGEAQGAYVHPKFQAGKPELVSEIRRLVGKANKPAPAPKPVVVAVPMMSVVAAAPASAPSLPSLLVKRQYLAESEAAKYKQQILEAQRICLTGQWESGLPSSLARVNPISEYSSQGVKRGSWEDFDFFDNIENFDTDIDGLI